MSYGKAKKQFDEGMKNYRRAVRALKRASSGDVPQDELDELIDEAIAWNEKVYALRWDVMDEIDVIRKAWQRDEQEVKKELKKRDQEIREIEDQWQRDGREREKLYQVIVPFEDERDGF